MSNEVPPERLRYRANFTTQGVAVGGTLELTMQEVRFEPNTLNHALASTGLNPQSAVSFSTSSIVMVGIQERTLNTQDGGLRRRLRIDTNDGGVYLFVINKLAHRVQVIRDLLGIDNTLAVPVMGKDSLQSSSVAKFDDPSLDISQKNAVRTELGAPKDRSLGKLFIGHMLFSLFAPLVAIPFKSTVLSVLLGVALPIGSWIILIMSFEHNAKFAKLKHMRTRNHDGTTVKPDSRTRGVNIPNMMASTTNLMVKMIALLFLLFMLGTTTSAVVSGVIESMVST